jgi:hypothetical protein
MRPSTASPIYLCAYFQRICKAYLWGPQQLPSSGFAGGMEWPERLAMIILELLRRAFSCAGCNSNKLEASWRGNLFYFYMLRGKKKPFCVKLNTTASELQYMVVR